MNSSETTTKKIRNRRHSLHPTDLYTPSPHLPHLKRITLSHILGQLNLHRHRHFTLHATPHAPQVVLERILLARRPTRRMPRAPCPSLAVLEYVDEVPGVVNLDGAVFGGVVASPDVDKESGAVCQRERYGEGDGDPCEAMLREVPLDSGKRDAGGGEPRRVST